MEENPYQSPVTESPVNDLPVSNSEIIRKEHLSHEASIKSIGVLYWLSGLFLLLMGIGQISNVARDVSPLEGIVVMGFLILLGCFQFWMGFGIRKIKKWIKIPLIIFSVIGLLGFPAGTLINIYILFLVLGKKGKMVFSDEYKEIIRETPHVKYKTSKAMWIILGLCLTAFYFSNSFAYMHLMN